jgi:hypothetical protein
MQISFSRIIPDMQQVETLKHGDSEYVGLETVENIHGEGVALNACPAHRRDDTGGVSAGIPIRRRPQAEASPEPLPQRLSGMRARMCGITQYPGFAMPLCDSVDPGGYVFQLSPRH